MMEVSLLLCSFFLFCYIVFAIYIDWKENRKEE